MEMFKVFTMPLVKLNLFDGSKVLLIIKNVLYQRQKLIGVLPKKVIEIY